MLRTERAKFNCVREDVNSFFSRFDNFKVDGLLQFSEFVRALQGAKPLW